MSYHDEERGEVRREGESLHEFADRLTINSGADRQREESDPTGRSQHEAGAKLDSGKPRMALVLKGFSLALTEVAKVGTYGAEKYSDFGFLDVPDGCNRYQDAMMRHFLDGALESIDASGFEHDAMVAWNAIASLEIKLRARRASQSNLTSEGLDHPTGEVQSNNSSSGPENVIRERKA